ncbi:hypothetical protein ACU4GD_20540 [Cupriavidus basilensis]
MKLPLAAPGRRMPDALIYNAPAGHGIAPELGWPRRSPRSTRASPVRRRAATATARAARTPPSPPMTI